MLVLLPCYSLESLSLERDSAEINQILSAWTVFYHPGFLEKEGKLPRWENASCPLKESKTDVVIIPVCCESLLPDDWIPYKEEQGTLLIREKEDRDEIATILLDHWQLTEHGFDPDFVADFFALGTAYFLTEIMTRQLRYMSMLDESQLKNKALEAIREYRAGDRDKARTALQNAFELLSQSKEYFYPGKSYLLNLLLPSEGQLGEPLRREIERSPLVNLFLPTELLRKIVESEPETLATLRKAIAEGTTEIIGDDIDSGPLSMLPMLEVADRIVQGILYYREHLGSRPEVFGRLRKGLSPILPQLLRLAGYQGAVHFTPRDGWQVLKENQSKITWSGIDGTKIEALLKFPLNAEVHETFFQLPKKMGYSMSGDSASTFVLAHHPLKQSRWLEDLVRSARYGDVLGEFPKLSDYFEKTKYVGSTKSFGFAKYWTNSLAQAVREERTGPVSDWVDYYRLHFQIAAFQIFGTLCTSILRGKADDDAIRRNLERHFAPLLETIENRLIGENPIERPAYEKLCQEAEETLVSQLAFAVYGKSIANIEKLSDREIEKIIGLLVVNPLGFSRTVCVDVSDLSRLPNEGGKVLLARRFEYRGQIRQEAILELPPFGYHWIGPGAEVAQSANEKPSARKSGAFATLKQRLFSKKPKPVQAPSLVEIVEEKFEKRGSGIQKQTSYLLRNELFEARIDATTGELRSITSSKARGNRFAHQIGFRSPEADRKNDPRNEHGPLRGYSIMAADRFEIESPGPVRGRLSVSGRLVRPDGTLAGKFRETFEIRRLSPVIEIEIEITPEIEPGEKPWDSYFASRFAWADSTLSLRNGLHGGAFTTDADLLLAPEFLDLRNENGSITILTGGLPYHRSFDENRLDTILIPKGEQGRKFRLGIAVDVPHPHQAASEFLLSDLRANAMIPCPKAPNAWFFALEAKNVQILRIEPLFEEGEEKQPGETMTGLRLILQEMENKSVAFSLRTFLPVAKAFKTDLLRSPGTECPIEGDRIRLEMHGRELLPLELWLK